MHEDQDSMESPDAILDELRKSLNSIEERDVELAEIVSQYILPSATTEDCVNQAMALITELALRRASSTKVSSDA